MKQLTAFLLAALLIAGCGKNPKTYLDEAVKKQQSNDIAGAIAEYEKMIKELPTDTATAHAYLELGKIYQGKLDKKLEPELSMMKAVENYQSLIKKFPDSKEVPSAMFMTAFIQANEMKLYDAAKINYQKFLDKYPNHELATSARQEIQFMGVSPDEIIQQKAAAK